MASLLLAEINILNDPYFQELLSAVLLPVALAIIRIWGHPKVDSLKAKGNCHIDISTRNKALKGPTVAKPLSWFKGIFSQMKI